MVLDQDLTRQRMVTALCRNLRLFHLEGVRLGAQMFMSVFLLEATIMIKTGNDYSFKNYAGRMISFSRSKAGNEAHDIILVAIQHKTDIGIMTLKESDELEIVTRNILTNIGYSNQEIAEKVKHRIAQSSVREDENAPPR